MLEDPERDDPIIEKIVECANRIRVIAAETDSMGVAPFSKDQLGRMLSHIQEEAEAIWKLAGVSDPDRQLTVALEDAASNGLMGRYPMHEED